MDMRTSSTSWLWTKQISPGQEQTLSSKNFLFKSQDILAWAFFPQVVEYADGSKWEVKQPSECFEMFWRDKEHPTLPVLPPLQVEVNED